MSVHTSAPAKILLIDTNVFFAKRVGDALKHEGFEVVHSTQSAYALTMIEYDPPAAIVCSTTLREMNAHELPPLVHADPRMAHIPVIAMGEGGDHALMEAFRSGCADYVDKRLGPEVIAAHIKSFLLSNQEGGFQPVQMLGALYVNAISIDGIIFFDKGNISHAESGDLIGDDAVVHIVKYCNHAENGSYKFLPGDSASTRTVLRSPTELLLEALRELDEGAHTNSEGGLQ